VAEVALALTLCFGAALLVRSVVTLSKQDTGFRAERLLTASITLPPRYKAPEARRAFWEQLIERLNTSAGVTGVAGSTALPFSNWEWQTTFGAADLPDLKDGRSSIRAITAGYFRQLGIPVLDGREFGSDDHASAEPVAIVNEVFARRFFSGRSPVGQRVRTDPKGGPWITVIGVTASTRHTRLDEDPMPELYRPISQTPEALLTIAVRAKGAAESIAPILYAAVRDIDVSVPLEQVKPMDVLVGETVAVRRFHMRLLSAFAALAGILTLVGIYGVTSYVVSLRTREIGIRVALGATPLAVQGQVVRQGVRPILAGLVIGGGIVAFAAQLIENQLFGVTAHDPATFALTASALLIVGTMACLAPARRCARVSPRTGLRR
jgi:putative ABC transport system permease protein